MEQTGWVVDPIAAWDTVYAEFRRRFEPLGFRVERDLRDRFRHALFRFVLESQRAGRPLSVTLGVAVDAAPLRYYDAKQYLLGQIEVHSHNVLRELWRSLPK
jgi:hypothetical protein